MHDMRSDLRTGIIEVEFIGFWTLDDLAAYKRDLADHAARISRVGRPHMLLIDHTRAAIQTQEIVAALGSLASCSERPSKRIAVFTMGQVAKLQAKRIAALREDIRVFDDRASALGWLMEAVAQPARRVAATHTSAQASVRA